MHTVLQLVPLLHMLTKMPPTSYAGLRRCGPGTESVWESAVEAHLSDAAEWHTSPAAPAAAAAAATNHQQEPATERISQSGQFTTSFSFVSERNVAGFDCMKPCVIRRAHLA